LQIFLWNWIATSQRPRPIFFRTPPSWGSDGCSKNGQKYWFLQCFVTKVGLKPLI
jgi:hypothetical protein